MKASIKKAFTFFTYAALLFTVAYWVYLLIDDWIFIEKYSADMGMVEKLDHLMVWLMYFAFYFFNFTVCYWLITLVSIFIYHTWIKHRKPI